MIWFCWRFPSIKNSKHSRAPEARAEKIWSVFDRNHEKHVAFGLHHVCRDWVNFERVSHLWMMTDFWRASRAKWILVCERRRREQKKLGISYLKSSTSTKYSRMHSNNGNSARNQNTALIYSKMKRFGARPDQIWSLVCRRCEQKVYAFLHLSSSKTSESVL